MFSSLGDYVQTKEYHEKALAIAIEIGDGKLKSHSQLHLGVMLLSLGIKYADANKFFREALLTATETRDRSCEAHCYQWLGNLFHRLGDPSKANEYFEKALAISVTDYMNQLFALTWGLCLYQKMTILRLKNTSRRHF